MGLYNNRIVVKVGTSTLTNDAGKSDLRATDRLVCTLSDIHNMGYEVILVSSGAIAVGRNKLNMQSRPDSMRMKQAAAAVGQCSLMYLYDKFFGDYDKTVAQILLNAEDIEQEEKKENLTNTFNALLEMGIIPIVNENDSVSYTEIESEDRLFGDNDMLGALVSAMVGADLYLICSDVDGLYTANPQEDPTATLIEHVDEVGPELTALAGGAGTSFGTGGMSSKLRAARAMLAVGVPMIICRGRRPDALLDAVAGERVGTRFEAPAGAPHEGGRKLWIGLAEVPRGSISLDAGATRAVLERGASILPVGVSASSGSFSAGDVVNVRSDTGDVVGRGVVRYSSEDMARVRGIKLDVIARFLGDERAQPAVHRDDLLVF